MLPPLKWMAVIKSYRNSNSPADELKFALIYAIFNEYRMILMTISIVILVAILMAILMVILIAISIVILIAFYVILNDDLNSE